MVLCRYVNVLVSTTSVNVFNPENIVGKIWTKPNNYIYTFGDTHFIVFFFFSLFSHKKSSNATCYCKKRWIFLKALVFVLSLDRYSFCGYSLPLRRSLRDAFCSFIFSFRSVDTYSWGDGQKLFYKNLDVHNPERSIPFTTIVASHDTTTGVTTRISRFPNPERTRSPPISYADVDALRNSDETTMARISRFPTPERTRSPPLSYADVDALGNSDETVTARTSRFPNPERTRSPPISYADVDALRNFDQTILRNK